MPTNWKEGRHGAISLAYLGLPPAAAWVLDHHARVGIRATITPPTPPELLAVAAERNWDLARHAASPADGLAVSTSAPAGWFASTDEDAPPAAAAYRVTLNPGEIAGPLTAIPPAVVDLPSMQLPTPLDAARRLIESVVARRAWAVLRVQPATLDALGPTDHAAMLSWLGDNHMRIWCAPVADIARWRVD